MDNDFSYSVSRFSVRADEEQLIGRAELIRESDQLVIQIDGVETRILATDNVAKAIATEPILSDIRSNQITRIKASGTALDLLPCSLRVPGDPDEFDEALWSPTLAEKHTSQDWVVQPGRCRVVYVNESRWCPWPTSDGQRVLPERWPMVDISPIWARLTFSELASMTSGLDVFELGLVTPRVVAACFKPDFGELSVELWQRTGEVTVDAQIFTRWLLDQVTESYGVKNAGYKVLLAQLFVEAGWNGENGSDLRGGRLAAGWATSLDFGDTDSSEWSLELNISDAVKSEALNLIEERGDRLSNVVIAARQPQSHEARARQAAVADWDEYWTP